ncbi:MAG: hypothetical protein P4L99_28615 [Chthoniobacter sp.]|nr:hypothetical protein [Chthoniobacter sp.]
MKIHFGQIYIESGVSFPFSFQFQRHLSDEISALVAPSAKFTQDYGDDWQLMFRVSAKRGICDNEIRGPSVFKKDKDVEFTIFLPFDVIHGESGVLQSAIGFLLQGVSSVLDSLGIDVSEIQAQRGRLSESISSDPRMFEPNVRPI